MKWQKGSSRKQGVQSRTQKATESRAARALQDKTTGLLDHMAPARLTSPTAPNLAQHLLSIGLEKWFFEPFQTEIDL